MKKSIYILCILALMYSCKEKKGDTFTLKGQIKGAENKQVVLETFSFPFINGSPKITVVDTATADAEGSFEIKDFLPERSICRLKILDTKQDVERYYMLSLWNEDMNFSAVIDDPGDPSVSGSPATKSLYTFIDSLDHKKSHVGLLREQVDQARGEKNDSLAGVFITKMNGEIDDFYAFIKQYGDTTKEISNAVVAYENLLFEQNFDDIKKFNDKAIHSADSSSLYVKELNDKVKKYNLMLQEEQQKTLLGKMAPDIIENDPAGNPLRLSDLKGKIVLVDFWASWCVPCRHENPNVVKAYNKYKDKGFIVFSVDLDTDKNKWLNAIKEDGLIWKTHVSALNGDNAAAVAYNISAIPMSYLVDQNGTIIAQNLRGKALDDKLAELMGN